MSSLSQETFDMSEKIGDALALIGGIESVLIRELDVVLSTRPDHGRSVFALIEAGRKFRQDAEVEVGKLACLSVENTKGRAQ